MKKIYKNLECLSVDDINRIHETTLDVLSDVGIKVRSFGCHRCWIMVAKMRMNIFPYPIQKMYIL